MQTLAPKPSAAERSPSAGSPVPARERSGIDSVLHLQHTIGNQAVQRLLTARAAQASGDPGPGSGAPLPSGLRSPLESYFDTSLDRVRVHTDPSSRATADQLDASAFTLGQDIHLGSDGIRAGGATQAALLAHEVAHTLQQGPVGVHAKPRVGSPGDAFERQADQLAAGFARFHRNPGDPLALKLRDSTRIRQIPGGEPVIRRGKIPTAFGEFEDFKYGDLTDTAGKKVGVEMYLKFHPGNNVNADLIGMTQAAEGKFNGTQITQGIYGQHSATSGPGVGSFIDRLEGYPNPIYPTTQALVTGGSATSLSGYQTLGITALTAAQQTAMATATGRTGVHYKGWGQHGHRKLVSGAFVSQEAELYDAPALGGAGADSEQVFETTALAIAGTQAGTYYGSVEWGWRTNAAGTFTRLPLRAVSQGVPSATFLTAASIWNPSKASFGYVTTAATDLLDATLTKIGSIPINTELPATGLQGTSGGVTYIGVKHGSSSGVVDSTAVRETTVGAATVDLPVPMIHTVSNPLGTTMILSTPNILSPGTTQALPFGTRVLTTASVAPQGALANHYEGEVADGPLTGTRGYFPAPDLTLEPLGKH